MDIDDDFYTFMGDVKSPIWTGYGKELKEIWNSIDFYSYYDLYEMYMVGMLDLKELDAVTSVAIKTIKKCREG